MRRERAIPLCGVTFAIVFLSSCATTSTHQFAEPAADWQVRTGQLLYRNAKTTMIGDVVVRFSKNGDFDLTFSKGPGVILLTLQQDATFARVAGAFARTGWSGAIDRAPPPLHGWLQLREKVIGARDQKSIRVTSDAETFLFRF